MILALKLKLPKDKDINEVMASYGEALNFLSKEIFEIDPIHPKLKSVGKAYYFTLKEKFGLFSAMAQSVMRDAIKMYLKRAKIGRKLSTPIVFKGSHISFVANVNFKFEQSKTIPSEGTIYLKLGEKRSFFKVKICPHYQQLLSTSNKVCDSVLVRRKYKGKENFYFCLSVEVEKKTLPSSFTGTMGIDVGVKKLATVITNKDKTFVVRGSRLTDKRLKFIHLRTRLQSKGTPSSKRVLKRLSKKETLWAEDHLFCIVRDIINFAMINKIGYIGIEDLGHINLKKIRKDQRAIFSAWPYSKFMRILKYKAEKEGFKVVAVPPYNTSLTCSFCEYCDKGNRKKQKFFKCKECGFTDNADINAARNIENTLW
jgi:IS605 OrfB family transposase